MDDAHGDFLFLFTSKDPQKVSYAARGTYQSTAIHDRE
jgi:hypothetical protein